MSHHTLYERLGGGAAITAVIDDFVARCAGDGRINGKFARTDIARLKAMLVEQVKPARSWPIQFLVRRTAHHVMDHAWEMEDRVR